MVSRSSASPCSGNSQVSWVAFQSRTSLWYLVTIAGYVLASAILIGCGDEGKPESPPPAEPTPPLIVGNAGPRQVTGRFFLGDTDHPASGHDLWILDHTESSYKQVRLGGDGAFRMGINNFATDHTYTFHLADSSWLLKGTLDLAVDSEGLQSSVRYGGGFGFDLGDVILGDDGFGRSNIANDALQAAVGGGFQLNQEAEFSMQSFGKGEVFEQIAFGSVLRVLDRQTLLTSLYLGETNPSSLQTMLKERSGFRLTIGTKEDRSLQSARLFQANSWRTAVRLMDHPEDNYGGGRLWKATGYVLSAASNNTHQPAEEAATTIKFEGRSGGLLSRGEMILLSLQPLDHPHRFIPKALDYVIARPPMIDAVAKGHLGAFKQIDYASTDENGLSRPFCGIDSTAFAINWPRDGRGEAINADRMHRIEIKLNVHGLDGQLISLVTKDWPAPYHTVVEEVDRFGSTRKWSPTSSTLTYRVLDLMNITQAKVEIPRELLAATIGDHVVEEVQATISFIDETTTSESAVRTWMKPTDCD